MKFFETQFTEYLAAHEKAPLHSWTWTMPSTLRELRNMILYGPAGVGKYTQMLAFIAPYSPSKLKYEKKMMVTYNKGAYSFRLSDVHFEVDMALLGCHSKLLWHEVYTQIVDIVMAKPERSGIIVCKNFQEIHSELLDTFYSYMQSCNSQVVDIKFILLTEQLSFIPNNIVNCCQVVAMPRPSSVPSTMNLKHRQSKQNLTALQQPHKIICDKLLDHITSGAFNVLHVRELLYDMFIYNLDVQECIWYVVQALAEDTPIDMYRWLPDLFLVLQYYNNNYRPIYHLENFVCALIKARAEVSTMG
jgi:hypothetical protein